MGKENQGKGNLNEEERSSLKETTKNKLEIAEVKQILWRKYRDGENEVLGIVKQRKEKLESEELENLDLKTFIPEGGKENKAEKGKTEIPVGRKSISEYFEEKRREKLARSQKLKEKWALLRTSLDFIENNEDWLIANMLERKYEEDKRIATWEKE
jgi:hypothetical protein